MENQAAHYRDLDIEHYGQFEYLPLEADAETVSPIQRTRLLPRC